MITVYLSDDDAELFKLFREHQDVFKTMLAHGVFNVRSGSATLNFDGEGTLDSVRGDVPLFVRGKKQIQVLTLN